MNKGIIIGIAVLLIVIAAGYWFMMSSAPVTPTQIPANTADAPFSASDEPETISQDLESVDIGNVENDFIDVDKDLQSL